MKPEGQLLPQPTRVSEAKADAPEPSQGTVTTRDHDIIRRWAASRGAEPATGEATSSGPATVDVNDGGAGIRFNFPGTGAYRPISWEEWLANFDRHLCTFVYEVDPPSGPRSYRYRIVRPADLKDVLA